MTDPPPVATFTHRGIKIGVGEWMSSPIHRIRMRMWTCMWPKCAASREARILRAIEAFDEEEAKRNDFIALASARTQNMRANFIAMIDRAFDGEFPPEIHMTFDSDEVEPGP